MTFQSLGSSICHCHTGIQSAIFNELLAVCKHETLGEEADKPGFVSIHQLCNTTLSLSFLTCEM